MCLASLLCVVRTVRLETALLGALGGPVALVVVGVLGVLVILSCCACRV